jgi:signal transduction histidine kinase
MRECRRERRHGGLMFGKKIRSPMAELLHALNQPLTGLQCSLEVTLAAPRTNEHYQKTLREGLVLTERLRLLVEAVREVAEMQDEVAEDTREQHANRDGGTVELAKILRESVEELAPVAEAKGVHLAFELNPESNPVVLFFPPATLRSGIFRLLEAAIAITDSGRAVPIAAGVQDGQGWFRVRWSAVQKEVKSQFSRPEVGLLIAQAGFERGGAAWQRRRTQEEETVTVCLPLMPAAQAASRREAADS